MKYIETEVNQNYTIKRYESENSLWELGWRMMMHGIRFNANPVGSSGFTIEYCGGSNQLFSTCLNGLMLQVFELLPESITEREFTTIFPRNSDIKPMYLDAAWQMLILQFQQLKQLNGDYTQLSQYFISVKLDRDFRYITLNDSNTTSVGIAIAEKIPEKWIINQLHVNRDSRRIGLGTYLLQYVCQELWKERYVPIILDTEISENDSLKSWYFSMGFKINHNGFCERKEGDYNYGIFRFITP